MDLNQNICSPNNNIVVNSGTDNYSNIIDKILNCANENLMMLMNQMLSSADKKLVAQADKSASDEDREKYLSCTQLFQTERNDISHLFFMKLNYSLSTTQSKLDADEESLVNQDEMDEMVAITTMHSKAMNTYGNEVHNLEARLEYLEIMCEEVFDKEALDPKHICLVFQSTIENIDLAIEAKLIFYKLFDQEVCMKLGMMYKSINQIFIDYDIMPEIVLNTTKNSEVEHLEDNVTSRVATYYDPEDKVQTDFVPRTKAEISRIVNQFMSGDMTITGDEIDLPESFLRTPTQQDLDGKNCYERKEVVKALSNLQRKLISLGINSKTLSTKQIKEELLNDITQDHCGLEEKKVNLLDERNIDFVGMMFDAITEDETISDIIKNMIKRLQIPIMKVAMSDNTLFENEEHPARIIVNLLTEAGKGINTEKDRLFTKLDGIVDNILNEYDTDLVIFDQAAHVLKGINDCEEQLARKTEKLQQKQIIQTHARTIVTAQFKMISRNKKIPNTVRPLILKNWSTLMLNRYLRHGRDSLPWSQSVSLLRLLMRCVQPVHFKAQHDLLKNNYMALTESVNDELYETQQNKKEISSQMLMLREHFLSMIEKFGYEVVDDSDEKIIDDHLIVDDEDETAELDNIKRQIESAEKKLSKLSSSTKPGAWYEIYTGEDKALRRLKLSVILNDAAQLIFVDRKGLNVIEKDAEEFARELEENRSRIIADHSTFDHALGKVIGCFAA